MIHDINEKKDGDVSKIQIYDIYLEVFAQILQKKTEMHVCAEYNYLNSKYKIMRRISLKRQTVL